jgi:hypothetical protein
MDSTIVEFNHTMQPDAGTHEKNPIIKILTETLEYIIEHPNNWHQESTTIPQEIQSK